MYAQHPVYVRCSPLQVWCTHRMLSCHEHMVRLCKLPCIQEAIYFNYRVETAIQLHVAGSGVLAIAALKLGAAQAYGTDTDALAVRAASQNAALNAMEGRFQAVQCEASTDGPEPLAASCGPAPVSGAFDVVTANILQVNKARPCSVYLYIIY